MSRIRAILCLFGILLFSPIAVSLNQLPSFLLNAHDTHDLLPIPLPWGDERIAREIDLYLSFRTKAKNGDLITIQSQKPDQFKYQLSIKHSQLGIELRVNRNLVAASIDKVVEDGDLVSITLIVNFDKKEVRLNNQTMHYFNTELDRWEGSLLVTIGSSNITETCFDLEKITISGEEVKLEVDKPDYPTCPIESPLTEVLTQKEDLVVPPMAVEDDHRGHVAHYQQPDNQDPENDESEGDKVAAEGSEDEPDMTGGENVLHRQKELGESEADKPKNLDQDEESENPQDDHVNVEPASEDQKDEAPEAEDEKVEEASVGESKAEDEQKPEPEVLAKEPEIGEGTNQQQQQPEQPPQPFDETLQKKLNDLMDQRPDPRPTFIPPSNCLPHQRNMCGPNGKDCEVYQINETTAGARCLCREGYAGKRCQFSLLPRSCHEAFVLNPGKINEPGAYELDVDGSGPLRSSWAYCNKEGHTIVEHNMPNETLIRQAIDTSDKYYPISYKLFENAQLQKLIDISEKCEQGIKFECKNAPLSFSTNTTWFETASNPGGMVKQIGDTPDHCDCPKEGCQEGRNCNCDSLASAVDEGVLRKGNAGITFIYALKNPINEPDAVMKATLGPLRCSGNAGNIPQNAITLKTVSASLGLQAMDTLTQFEFEFRTDQQDIMSLLALDGSYAVTVSLRGGHTIEVKKKENDEVTLVANIMSQSKLSDQRWHRILLEIIQDEIRISIDSYSSFSNFSKESFPRTITIGQNDGIEGFIGCIRNVAQNGSPIAATSLTKNLEMNFQNECPNLCRGHNCEQGSKCIENFATGTRTCQCANRFIHRGERCEKNVNTNTEVSFHDKKQGFLEYRNDDLPKNPLESSIIAFSVRTDQKQAVFLYAHDQSDNFLQVHLADEFRIILTLSNYSDVNIAEVKSCTVFSKTHDEFSDMRWLQIIVERFNNRTTLSVDDEQCEIMGPTKLAPLDIKIEDYRDKPDYAILPPKAQGSSTVIEAYHILFIGGVPRPLMYTNLRRKRARPVFYDTPIPPILGCIRGFIIDDQIIDMRNTGKRLSTVAVQNGCYTECDSIVCKNGGHCTYKWENRDPQTRDMTSCDCSKTSYFGSSCLKDTGVTFEGKSSLLYNIEKAHQFDLTRSEEQTFRFAFAPLANEKSVQQIAAIYFNNNQEIQIILHPNQSINVAYIGLPDRIYTFGGNYSDGYRHFFQAIFSKGSPVLFVIDSEKQYAEEGLKLHLADAISYRFGGKLVSTDDQGFAVIDAYKGCLSNVDIDFHQNIRTHFMPLVDYLNPNFENRNILIDEPDITQKLSESRCADFLIPGVLPSLQRNVNFPVWEAVFSPVTFHSNFTPEISDDVGPDDGMPWWLILLILLLILLLLACCLYCLCCKPKKRPTRSPSIGHGVEPEKIPLTEKTPSLKEQPLTPLSVKDNFELPPANKPLFKPDNGKLPDRPPLPPTPDSPIPSNKASLSSIYYTAQEYPLDADSIDAYADDDKAEDLDNILSQGFGEERPNVMDKKTKNLLDKTNLNRVSSFDNADAQHPPRPAKILTPAAIPRLP